MNTHASKIRVLAQALSALALLVSVSACGKGAADAHEPVLRIDGFESYVATFEQSAADHGRALKINDLIIQFGQVDGNGETGGRGVCERTVGETPVVTISPAAWESSSEAEREELIFHELGHCVLHKAHVGGLSGGIPRSIMNPYKIDGAVYSKYKDFYLAGLFQ